MNTDPDDAMALTPIKRALLEIRTLRSRVTAFEKAAAEPIAVIGMGCRMPGGVYDEASLWHVLNDGIDTIREVPADRWNAREYYDADPDRPGTMSTCAGGFLDDVAGFDATLFGIAPREAISMDPQQRLMLEVVWEALEDAGIPPDCLGGTSSGVFVGVGNNDYGRMLMSSPDRIDAYAGSGGSLSVIAGRLSYVFGLQGPAIAVDTACSASLVAVHLACQSLRGSECDLALAGGVNLILSPDAHIAFSKARMLAKDGRCKAFDAAADGYGRGEGAGVVVLRRLSDAQARGDRILALIRGSAINQDGRSGGLTAPNGPAQEAVIRAALANAGLRPEQIDYVEAHGTGTELGDPIELQALAAALSSGRPAERALLVGSCKTNFAHLEAAAGITGLLKVVASLRRRSIPPHLHFNTPNPLIDWAHMAVRVPKTPEVWPEHSEPARAGVSSFGFSGTNAHVVLEEAPAMAAPCAALERSLHLLALSARDDAALMELVRRYRSVLAANGAPVVDICFTANTGRAQLGRRISVRGASAAELNDGLSAVLAGGPHRAVVRGAATGKVPTIAFLFSGQGAQYHGMARGLYETSPVFRKVIDRCAVALDGVLDLVGLLYGDGETQRINDTANAQPALFAIEVALAELWRSWGVEPAILIGHSLGEYAAACVAGVLTIEDGLRLLVSRGQLTQGLPGDGAMASAMAPPDVVQEEIAALDAPVSIAAYNGPQHVVVSGARPMVERLIERLARGGVQCRELRISHAFHSPLIEPALAPFGDALAGVSFAQASTVLISNVTGRIAGPDDFSSSAYWLRQMRSPVRFEDCVREALAQGVTHFVEIGPHPVLLAIAAECASGEARLEWLPSLRRDTPDWLDLIDSLQRLYVGGARIKWSGFDEGYARSRVAAPTMPFQHRRFWIDWSASARSETVEHRMDDVGQANAPDGGEADRWSHVTSALRLHADQGPLDVDATSYPAKLDCLARLTSAHAIHTLSDAGLFARAGEQHRLEGVLSAAGIGSSYYHLVQRWLGRLVAQGLLRSEGETYVADAPLPDPGLPSLWVETERLFADDRPLLAYVRRCGELLSQVLRGNESALETLFPGGSFDLAQDLYERSQAMRYVNALVASAFESLGAHVSRGRTLRVLEVGAGTGGTTGALLSVLPPDRTSYLFTDVSDVFLDGARRRFGSYPFLTFGRLDLDKDLAAQGYLPGSFDVIVSANAVHASTDLRLALRRLHDLLAPGGLLILVESTIHFVWFDMTTGLIEGWQHFADDLRTDNPLLSVAKWVEALRAAGFNDAGAWPQSNSPAGHFGLHVVVARAAGVPVEAIEAATQPGLSAQTEVSISAEQPVSFRQRVLDTLPADRLDLMRDFVRERVVQILRLDPAEPPDRNDRLMDLGFDSLMAVQLRNLLGKDLGIERPLRATVMFDYPTINTLATHLLDQLIPTDSGNIQTLQETSAREPALLGAAAVAAMSDAEIESRLLERLERQ